MANNADSDKMRRTFANIMFAHMCLRYMYQPLKHSLSALQGQTGYVFFFFFFFFFFCLFFLILYYYSAFGGLKALF